MGATFTGLTWDGLCDFLYGKPEEEQEEEQWEEGQVKQAVEAEDLL